MPVVPQHLHHSSPKPSHTAPGSSPPLVPPLVPFITRKTTPPTTNPSSPCSSSSTPDWRPHPPVSSNITSVGPEVNVAPNKSGTTVVKGQAASGNNGGPPTSTPRTSDSQEKTVAVTPTKCPPSLCSTSPVVGSSSGQNWRERDSGLSQSLLLGHDAGDSHSEEVEKLLEDCRTTLGFTATQDGTMNTTGKSSNRCFNRFFFFLHTHIYIYCT